MNSKILWIVVILLIVLLLVAITYIINPDIFSNLPGWEEQPPGPPGAEESGGEEQPPAFPG